MLLVVVALWALNSAVNSAVAVFRDEPPPVGGSPFDHAAPPPQASSGSPTIDRITERGRLIVSIQEMPGLAIESGQGSRQYTGFDIELLKLIADELKVDPARTSFKPLPPGSRERALDRHEADLVLGGYEITPQRNGEVDFAGPYLESPLRLAVPADSPVTGLNSLGAGEVCAPQDSPATAALTDRLADRLETRSSLGACGVNLLRGAVQAIAGDEAALHALPAMASGELRVVGEPLGTTEYGIGLPLGDQVLRDRVNAVLRTAIADGTWARLYAQYLGSPVPTPPVIPR